MSTHTAQTQLQLVGKLILSGELRCETGLHIGAGKGSLEIGGADNPVVKDAFGLPYIPGSSLRGRIRSLLENALGLTSPAELVYLSKRKGQEVRIHQSDRPDDEITEVKSENAIDRITSQANPRTLERVPAGARFHVRMVLDVLCEEDKALAARLIEGLRLLEDDALGGGGSRGSGRVRFANLKLVWRNRTFYSTGGAETELASAADLTAVQALANDASFGEKLAS